MAELSVTTGELEERGKTPGIPRTSLCTCHYKRANIANVENGPTVRSLNQYYVPDIYVEAPKGLIPVSANAWLLIF